MAQSPDPRPPDPTLPELREDEERELLRIARTTLREFFASGIIPPGAPHRKALLEPTPVWVRLHGPAGLRGSFGILEPPRPFWRGVQEASVQAAVNDPRRKALDAAELDGLRIEILALSALVKVSSEAHIAVDRHGVVITAAGGRAVMLPDEHTERSAEELLGAACVKAGLPVRAWRQEDADVSVFSVHSFSEPGRGTPPAGSVKERP